MTNQLDRITQKYLRRYPISKRTKSWAGRMVHIQTENGVWRINGKGYTYAHKQDAWVLSFEDAQKQVNHCGPEKQAAFIDATTRAVPDVPGLVRYSHDIDKELFECPDGEYVRHDQAVAVIAKKQAKTKDALELADRMDGFAKKYLSHLNNERQDSEQKSKDWFGFCELIGVDIDSHEAVADKIAVIVERAEAAEAKLAKSEKQEIFGYIIDGAKVYENPRIHQMSVRGASTPVYLAPVASDAKLRAENERLKAEKAAMRKAATYYCWQRYKSRAPMNLRAPAVFTSHEWQKIGEVMDEAIAAINPSESRT